MKLTEAEKEAIQQAKRKACQVQPPIMPWGRGEPNWLWCETANPDREDGVCGVLLPVGHTCEDCGETMEPL